MSRMILAITFDTNTLLCAETRAFPIWDDIRVATKVGLVSCRQDCSGMLLLLLLSFRLKNRNPAMGTKGEIGVAEDTEERSILSKVDQRTKRVVVTDCCPDGDK